MYLYLHLCLRSRDVGSALGHGSRVPAPFCAAGAARRLSKSRLAFL